MRLYLRLFTLPLLVLILLVTATSAQAAVTLISFDAIANIANQRITILWETGSELDFAGFYIQRSLSPDNGFERLLDPNDDPLFFPAQGVGGSGWQYLYDDTDVVVGGLYYYQLEMIDLGAYPSYSDVIFALWENAPTPTSSSTATLTVTPGTQVPTATITPTQATPTRTKTPQPTVTITRTPSPYHVVTFTSRPRSSSTPSETSTITSTPSVSPTVTTTLAPLPSLTLLFPVRTPTPTFTPLPTFTPSPFPPTPTPTPKPDNHIPLRICFLGGIIVMLWLILAGFLYVYLRRISR